MKIFILLVALAILLAYILVYNSLIRARQKAKEAWSGVDVQLKRRHDLIPALVEVVRAYAKHENQLLEKVAQLRRDTLLLEGQAEALGELESKLNESLLSIFAVAENYPELKASVNFRKLQEELTETEDQIAAARSIYNSNVERLNSKLQSFPQNLIAGAHGFRKMDFFNFQT